MSEDRDQTSIMTNALQPPTMLALRRTGGDDLAMRLIDVNADECRFSCPSAGQVILPLGTTIALALSLPDPDGELELEATVVFRGEYADGRQYRARFLNHAQLPLRVYGLITHRSDYRVKPAPKEPISVRVSAAMAQDRLLQLAGKVEDISINGIGIWLKQDGDAELALCEQIRIEFELPGERVTRRSLGRIKNRMLSNDKLLLGVQFDRERSGDFAEGQRAIGVYVARRLQEEAKREYKEQARLGAFL